MIQGPSCLEIVVHSLLQSEAISDEIVRMLLAIIALFVLVVDRNKNNLDYGDK